MDKINKLFNRSEKDYNEYLAKQFLKDINNWKAIDLIKESYLNKVDLVEFPQILLCFNKFLNKSFKEDLVNLILLSRSSKEIDLACSNAATILAKSDFIFQDLDFSQIRIPKADLSQRLFVNVNFESSYLKEVNFFQSQLHNVNFKNCDLSCANFGNFVKFISKNAKELSFSADDKYIYYKNDEDAIGIDLKKQKIRNEFSLSDFIASNISQIYRSRMMPYSLTVHGQYIRLWNIHDKHLIGDINIHRLVISPNWKYIAAFDTTNLAAFSWDIEKSMQFLGTSKEFTYRGKKLLFSPSSRYLAIIISNSISVIETQNWTLFLKIYGKFRAKNIFAISYCGKKIATEESGYIYLINLMNSAKSKIFIKFTKILCLSFSPCGNFLAVGFWKSSGIIIDLKLKQIFQSFAEGSIQSAAFSNSGKYISWSDSNGNIKIYEFSPKFLPNDTNRHLQVNLTNVSLKGTYLITWSKEKAILWELINFYPKQIKQFMNYNINFNYDFSPFETYIVKKIPGKVQIYDIERDHWLKTIVREKWIFFCYTFFQSENYFICLNDCTYEYFRIPDMETVRKIDNQQRNLFHVRFSKHRNYDFWGSFHVPIVWDLEKGEFMKNVNPDKLNMRDLEKMLED